MISRHLILRAFITAMATALTASAASAMPIRDASVPAAAHEFTVPHRSDAAAHEATIRAIGARLAERAR